MRETETITAPFAFPLATEAQDPVRRLTLVFWAGVCLGLLALALDRRHRRLAQLVFITGVAVIGCLFLVANHPGGLTPATGAVGRATYLGLSTSSNIHALEAMYLVAALIGIGAAVWERRAHVLGQEEVGQVQAGVDADAVVTATPPATTESDATDVARARWPHLVLTSFSGDLRL